MKQWPVISCEYEIDRGQVETCMIEIPVGTSSADRVVVFGEDGYLFVYSGGNDICGQYLMPEDEARTLASGWYDLIAARRALAASVNCRFLQMIIPEKSSVLPEKVPFPAAAGTPLMRAVTAGQRAHGDYVDVRELFNDEEALHAFPKANGHMAPFGTIRAFQAALERLGFEPPAITLGDPVLQRSDLGDHFSGMTFYNHVPQPVSPELATYRSGLTLVDSTENDAHMGQSRTWSNPTAPEKKRVLAFANSFFERGSVPAGLSWWFSTWFSDFKFVWASELDPAEIEAFKPDIIICQTIERFLPTIPAR